MGGQRGLNLFPEGHDGRGWSRVSRELSKALALLGATDGSPCSGGPPARNKLGKEAGLPSFAEVVHSAATAFVMGCRPLGQNSSSRGEAKIVVARPVAKWCKLEKIQPPGREMVVIQQAVDCSTLEKQMSDPLGNTLRVSDGSRYSLTKGDVDPSMQEKDRLIRKLLDLFGEWIVWACRITPILGLKCFGLKRKAGRVLKRAKVVFRRARFRVGSSRLGSKPLSKKDVLVGSDAVVVSSLVSSSGFGVGDGRLLGTRVIPGPSSPVATDGPSPRPVPTYFGPEYPVKAFGSDASVVSGSATSGSAFCSSELSIPPEGAGSYLMDANLSVSKGFANLSGPGSSIPESASASPGVLLPMISPSSPCTAFCGSSAIASSFEVGAPLGCSDLDS
jgi:hypothetical protein